MNLKEACYQVGINSRMRYKYENSDPISRAVGLPPERGGDFREIGFTTDGGVHVIRTRLQVLPGSDPDHFQWKLGVITSTDKGHLHSLLRVWGDRAGSGFFAGNWDDEHHLFYYPSTTERARLGLPKNNEALLLSYARRSFMAPDRGFEVVGHGPSRDIDYLPPPLL